MSKLEFRWIFLIAMILFLMACTSAPPTLLLPPVSVDEVKASVVDPNYMKGCREINSSDSERQVSYKGIIPGSATSIEVKNQVGDPLKKSSLIDQWIYDGFSIVFENEIVTSIYIQVDSEFNSTLFDIIIKYGCPDVIFAYDVREEKAGVLGEVSFVYYRIGANFRILNYPVNLLDKAEFVEFFPARSLDEYLTGIEETLGFPNTVKLVSWDEAVAK